MEQCWQADETADLAWRHWDGEYVVHHALSNDTHRLSELAGLVLIRLHAEPLPWTRAALADACDADLDEIDAALRQLSGIDLVRAC